MRRVPLFLALPVASVLAWPVLAAPRGPSYHYQGTQLLLLGFRADEDTQATLRWQAVGPNGQPVGALRQSQVIVGPRAKPLMLRVGERPGHRVSLRIGKEHHTLWANRGSWYARPARLHIGQNVLATPSTAFQSRDDVLLASGMSFRSGAAGARLLVGRTMGFESGKGVALPKGGSLVIVARASLGAMRLTLSERIGPKALRYYDYPLVMTPRMRRYVIPLSALTPRDLRRGAPPRTMHSLTLESYGHARAGSSLDLELLGLRLDATRITSLRRSGKTLQLRWQGKATTAHVGWLDAAGKQHQKVAGRLVQLPNSTRALWLCYGEGSHGGCYPADAPLTRIAPPPVPGSDWTLDDFDGLAPVDPSREPLLLFASTPSLQQTMRARRSGHSLELAFVPTAANDYVGVRVAVPEAALKGYKSVELTLRSSLPPNAVALGVRDARGKEPKVRLGGYAESLGAKQWTTLRVPLIAFQSLALGFKDKRPLAKIAALSLTLEVATVSRAHRLELDRIRLLRAIAPLTLASFEVAPGQTDLGGPITSEARFGAAIHVERAPGRRGSGLKVEVRGIGGKAYGLVSLGLRRLDGRGYKELRFWIRGEVGGETPSLLLKDRRKPQAKARLALSSFGALTTTWQQIRIPLARLAKLVRVNDLEAILLTWEDRTVSTETIYVDHFSLH